MLIKRICYADEGVINLYYSSSLKRSNHLFNLTRQKRNKNREARTLKNEDAVFHRCKGLAVTFFKKKKINVLVSCKYTYNRNK